MNFSSPIAKKKAQINTVRLVSTTARCDGLLYFVTDTPKKLKKAMEKTTPIAQIKIVAGLTNSFMAKIGSSMVLSYWPHTFSEGQGMKANRIRKTIVVDSPTRPSQPTSFMGWTWMD